MDNIKFIDYDGKIIKEFNSSKINPPTPKRYFYKFVGWNPDFDKNDLKKEYIAQYVPIKDNNKNGISDEEEFIEIIKNIVNDKEFLKRKNYHHHGDVSVYEHSYAVAYYAYKMAKKLNLDYKSATIGAILHDFYYNDWQLDKEKKPLLKQHGFVHAKEALENSKINYPQYINSKVENSIKRHMFPLNAIPPKYKEAWIVSLSDKYVSMDTIKNPKILLSFFVKKYRK